MARGHQYLITSITFGTPAPDGNPIVAYYKLTLSAWEVGVISATGTAGRWFQCKTNDRIRDATQAGSFTFQNPGGYARDIRLYKSALSDEEILAIANAMLAE